jgi:hypothetical protein
MEERFGCHNYHPLPVVLDRGEGIKHIKHGFRDSCLGS